MIVLYTKLNFMYIDPNYRYETEWLMNNEHRLCRAPARRTRTKDYRAPMTAIVEHQLPPGSKLPEEALAEVFAVEPHRHQQRCCNDSPLCNWSR